MIYFKLNTIFKIVKQQKQNYQKRKTFQFFNATTVKRYVKLLLIC